MHKISLAVAVSLLGLALLAPGASAVILWGNNASYGNVTIEAFDLDTGAVLQQFLVPNPLAVSDNGRGIAVVGTTIYYTVADRGEIFITDSVSHADLGTLVNTGLGGISCIAYDGTDLWITAYDGTNNAYKYDLAGNLVGTVLGFGNNRDGFEIAGNHIITNRGDAVGPYDLYDLSGVLVQSAFITTNYSPTGITYDGTNYYVSDIYNNAIETFDAGGNFVSRQTLGLPLPAFGARYLEDISVLGNVVNNPPPGGEVPEPGTLFLLGAGALGLCVSRRKVS